MNNPLWFLLAFLAGAVLAQLCWWWGERRKNRKMISKIVDEEVERSNKEK